MLVVLAHGAAGPFDELIEAAFVTIVGYGIYSSLRELKKKTGTDDDRPS